MQQQAPVSAPAFVQRLAGLGGIDALSGGPALSARLGQWIDWNRAIALSRTLDRTPAAGTAAPMDASLGEACAQARASLAAAILRKDEATADPAAGDFGPFRRRCLDLQHAMLASTGRLRGRLRDALAQGSADQARLAELDAVMEQTLSPREQALLATTPELLGRRFEHLAQAHADAADAAWHARFHREMQDVLLAELDVRFLPIDALLAALRTSPDLGTP